MVCENGLVISTEQFNDVKMRHMGYTFEELQAQIREMVEQLPLTVESMNKMKQIQLNEEQAKALAKKALTTRFTEEQVKNVQVDLDELLKPTRDEDKGTDLWSVFNVIQEKILNGDFNYISGVKQRKARKVKNFKQDMEINQKLFAMAAEFTAA
jgi:tetrahydrodipicolinate N-succinyltransferase